MRFATAGEVEGALRADHLRRALEAFAEEDAQAAEAEAEAPQEAGASTSNRA